MAMQNAVVYEIVGEYEYQETLILGILEYDSDEITTQQVEHFVTRTYGKNIQVMCGVHTERLVVRNVPTVVVDDMTDMEKLLEGDEA